MPTDLIQELSEDELPLFPLHVVLFPGGILPLHIFEQRYRLMIQFCLDNERPFGVVLIKSGPEAGGSAEPHVVGTVVKIVEVDQLEDGRMNLVAHGQYRFKIINLRQDAPYLVGRVRTFKTDTAESHEDLESLSVRAIWLYKTYESLLAKLIPDWELPSKVPMTPARLSYQIGARLQIALTDKQRLLETLPIDRLLTQEIELLERENQKLRANLVARDALEARESTDAPQWKGVSLN